MPKKTSMIGETMQLRREERWLLSFMIGLHPLPTLSSVFPRSRCIWKSNTWLLALELLREFWAILNPNWNLSSILRDSSTLAAEVEVHLCLSWFANIMMYRATWEKFKSISEIDLVDCSEDMLNIATGLLQSTGNQFSSSCYSDLLTFLNEVIHSAFSFNA